MTSHFRRVIAAAVMATAFSATAGGVVGVFKAGILARDPSGMCDALYVPSEGAWYLLSNLGSYVVGDTVVVTADGTYDCLCNNDITYGCLSENTIEAWRNLDLGCGVVSHEDDEYHCQGFTSFKYGSFSIEPSIGFSVGDSARVWGNMAIEECGAIWECDFGYCLDVTKAAACSDSSSAVQSVSWGKLKRMFR